MPLVRRRQGWQKWFSRLSFSKGQQHLSHQVLARNWVFLHSTFKDFMAHWSLRSAVLRHLLALDTWDSIHAWVSSISQICQESNPQVVPAFQPFFQVLSSGLGAQVWWEWGWWGTCCSGSRYTPHVSLSSLTCCWPQHPPPHPTDQKGNLSAVFPGPATLSSLDLVTKMALMCRASSATLILVLCHPVPLATIPTSPNCPPVPSPDLPSAGLWLCFTPPFKTLHLSPMSIPGPLFFLLWPSNDCQFIFVAPSQLPFSASRSVTSHHAKSSL